MDLGFESSGTDDDFFEIGHDVDLAPHERKLAIASKRLARSSSAAQTWAIENPEHPASYLLVREDLDDQARVRALRRIESISLPQTVRDLLEADQDLHECQSEAEVIREAELAVSAIDSDDDPEDETNALLNLAYLELLSGYRNWGGYRYHGTEKPGSKHDYPGPMIWSEQDAVFRIAKILEVHFPGRVHLDHRLNGDHLSGVSKKGRRSHRLPLVVAKPGLFVGELSRREFRTLEYDLLLGVSWLPKTGWTRARRNAKRCEEIQGELEVLRQALKSGLSDQAAMLIYDDEGFLEFHGDLLRWPKGVVPMVVSPNAIQTERLGNGSMKPFLDRSEAAHGLHCSLCR